DGGQPGERVCSQRGRPSWRPMRCVECRRLVQRALVRTARIARIAPKGHDGDMHNTSAHPWTKNYQPGVPAEIELPTESLAHMFARSVAQAGDSPATEFFGRQMSYAELGEQV